MSVRAFFSGGYTDALESYLSDSFAERTAFLAFSEMVGSAYGVNPGGATLVTIDNADFGSGLLPEPDFDDLDPAYYTPGQAAPGQADNTHGSGYSSNGQRDDGPGESGSASVTAAPETQDERAEADDGDIEAAGTEEDDETGGAFDDGEDASGALEEDGSDGAGDDDGSGALTDDADDGSGDAEESDATDDRPDNRVNINEPFGVDIHNDPDAVLYSGFYIDGPSVSDYIRILNSYRDALPDTARVFCMLVPTKVEFLDEKYREGIPGQYDLIRSIYNHLDPDIIRVDAYGFLAAHAADEYLYFRTDHHWTAIGAYYAYLAYAEAGGLEPVTIDRYVENNLGSFLGSLVFGTPGRNIREHPDTMYYYTLDNGVTFSRRLFRVPENLSNLDYRMFMGGDYDILDYSSTNSNGRTLVVVKDSYANAFIPWASPNYERIIVIDPRQYTGSVGRLLNGLTDVDVLFLNNAMVPSLRDFVPKLETIR